jgi:hypothetical protein
LNFRHLDIEDPKQWIIVKWIWTKLLNAAAGKLAWSKEKFYKEGVSKLYVNDSDTGQHCFNINVSMEAFAVVTYANNKTKYEKIREDKANNKSRGEWQVGKQVTHGILVHGGLTLQFLILVPRWQVLQQVHPMVPSQQWPKGVCWLESRRTD